MWYKVETRESTDSQKKATLDKTVLMLNLPLSDRRNDDVVKLEII